MNVDNLLFDLFYLATFGWMAAIAFLALLRLASGVRRSILVVIIVHFLLTGVPLFLDVVVGRPAYHRFPGFRLASTDEATNLIYSLYILATAFLWWWIGRKSLPVRPVRSDSRISVPAVLRPLLFVLLLSPLIALAFAPNPAIYATYGAALELVEQGGGGSFHSLVGMLALISVISGALILALSNKSILRDMPILFVTFAAVSWVYGKRSIIAIGLFLWGFVLWYRGYFRGGRLFVAGLLGVLLLAGFSLTYQTSVRNLENTQLYENFRIDYGRDDVIKMAIYAELHPDTIQVLEYRGQSILFHLATYIPRAWWPGKPLPYAQYVTSALFLQPPRLWGWGMTTSWLEEAIANFSWLGFLIGPLTIALICRVGDRKHNILVFVLTSLVASLLLAVQLTAFVPIFLLWLVAVIWSGYRIRGRKAGALATARWKAPSTT